MVDLFWILRIITLGLDWIRQHIKFNPQLAFNIYSLYSTCIQTSALLEVFEQHLIFVKIPLKVDLNFSPTDQ